MLSQGRICWANEKLDVVEGSGRYVDRPPFPISYEAVAKMNQAKMNSIPVAFPPLAEQKRIVARVDQLMALIDALE